MAIWSGMVHVADALSHTAVAVSNSWSGSTVSGCEPLTQAVQYNEHALRPQTHPRQYNTPHAQLQRPDTLRLVESTPHTCAVCHIAEEPAARTHSIRRDRRCVGKECNMTIHGLGNKAQLALVPRSKHIPVKAEALVQHVLAPCTHSPTSECVGRA